MQTRTQMVKCLREFGLESGSTSIVLVTDAEEAVSDLVAGASAEFSFQVRKAAPQDHEANGSAERAVRKLREGLQTLRSDLNQENLDISFSHDEFSAALLYLCASFNRFSRAHGSDLAPCDVAVGMPHLGAHFQFLVPLFWPSCLSLCELWRRIQPSNLIVVNRQPVFALHHKLTIGLAWSYFWAWSEQRQLLIRASIPQITGVRCSIIANHVNSELNTKNNNN